MKPEYIHILLNPYITHGLPFAALILLGGIILKNRSIINVGLAYVTIVCLLIYPTVEFGEWAGDRLSGTTTDIAKSWLDEHEKRAEFAAPFFYICAVLGISSIFTQYRNYKLAKTLTTITLIVALSLCALAGYVAYAGGRVAHIELRE